MIIGEGDEWGSRALRGVSGRGGGARRWLVIVTAAAIGAGLGVRSPHGHASPWEMSEFKGRVRAAIALWHERGVEDRARRALEVFASGTYATELSRFRRGVFVRFAFPLNAEGDTAVLTLDLNRGQSRSRWSPMNPRHAELGLYVARSGSDTIIFDGIPVAGELELRAVRVGHDAIAFRIQGWLEFVAVGPDGQLDSADDEIIELELNLETVPPPEELAGGDPSPLPGVDLCAWPSCYDDPAYGYDPYAHGPACGDAGVGYTAAYEDDGAGCGGGPTVEGWEATEDGWTEDGWADDGWTFAEDEPGCGESREDRGDAGCGGDTGTDSAGCEKREEAPAGGGGCGSDTDTDSDADPGCGCEGDTVDGQTRQRVPTITLNAASGWIPLALLLALVLGAHRRRGGAGTGAAGGRSLTRREGGS